jgi:formate dehydrogenase iron-sulfur subunit
VTISERELSSLPPGADLPHQLPVLLERVVGPFRRGAAPAARPPTGFYTDTTVCIGCKACEVACKQWNQLPADGFDWTGNSYDNTATLSATSWRHVKFIEQLPAYGEPGTPAPDGDGFDPGRWLMMSDVCKHCETAPCQQACPTGAIIHNEFDNVYIQPDICNGCAYCIAACPFGVITRSTIDGHAHKCTLCFDRQRDGLVPACAKACPTESIQFGPVDELLERARTRVETLHQRGMTEAYLYGAEAGETYSSLNSFYLLVDRPSVYGLPDRPVNPWLAMKGDYLRAFASGLVSLAALLGALLLVGR